MNAQETRSSDFGHPYDEKVSEDVKQHAKEDIPRFMVNELVTFKRLKMECKVLECLGQERDLRGRLTSSTKYLVKGTYKNMIVDEYELLTDKMIAESFNNKNK